MTGDAASKRESDSFLVYFRIIHDEVSAARISSLIGLEPTISWVKGQPVSPGSRVLRKFHSWEFAPALPPAADVEGKLDALLDRLEPFAETILALDESFERQVILVPHVRRTDNWGFFLASNTVQRLGTLKASVDVDAYFEDDDPDESLDTPGQDRPA